MPNQSVYLSSQAILRVGNESRIIQVQVWGISGPQRDKKIRANMKVVCRVVGERSRVGGEGRGLAMRRSREQSRDPRSGKDSTLKPHHLWIT